MNSGETMYICEFCLASLPSNHSLKRHTVNTGIISHWFHARRILYCVTWQLNCGRTM